jgi:Cys-rich protein (TIGR01571 family)
MATYAQAIYVQPAEEKICPEPFAVDFTDVQLTDEQKPAAIEEPAETMIGMPVTVAPPPANPRWSTGLCDCADDMNSCMENLVCLHCQNSRQYNMLHYGSNKVHWLTAGMTLVGDLLALAFIPTPVCIGSACLNWHNRTFLRKRYSIEGNTVKDFFAAMCCMPCVTCQNYREMSVRDEWSSGCCLKEPFAIRQPLVLTMGEVVAPSQ